MRKVRARVFSLMLVCAMVLSLLPVTALAEGNVAKIGKAEYDTLQAAVNAVPTDGTPATIELIGDVDGGTLAPEKDGATLTVAAISAGQNITLDLAGHTISAALSTNGDTYGMAQVIRNEGVLTIVDSSEAGTGKISASVSYGCTATVRNEGQDSRLTVESGEISSAGGNAIRNQNGLLTVNGGTLSTTGQFASFDNGTAAIHNRGDVVINDGYFSTEYQAPMWYGLGADNSTTEIKGGTFTSVNSGVDIQGSSGTVSVTGGKFHISPIDYVAPGYYVSRSDRFYVVESAGTSVTVTTFDELKSALADTSGTVNITVSGTVTVTEDITVPESACLFISDAGTLAFDDAVLTLNGYLINRGTLDVSGIGSGFISNLIRYIDDGGAVAGLPAANDSGVYEITTAAELQMMHFVLLANGDDSGIFHGDIVLADNIDLTGYKFLPLGYNYATAFGGTLDGQGNTITGLTINLSAGGLGLFSVSDSADFKNLTIAGASLTTQSGVMGTLVGELYGSSDFVNVTVSGTYTNAASYYCGGWIGYMGYSENGGTAINFIDCHNEMDVTGYYNVGAFWGSSSTGSNPSAWAPYVTMINCSNSGNVTATGGTIGIIGGFAYNDGVLYNFSNSGTITNQGNEVSNPQLFNGKNPINNTPFDVVAIRYDSSGRAVPYDSLDTAVSAAQDGDTITLLRDITLGAALTVGKDITIDGQGQYTVTGHIKLENGTLKDMTVTSEPGEMLLTIGSSSENTIGMEGVTVNIPLDDDSGLIPISVENDKANITIDNCVFMNEAVNGAQTEGAAQWSYGLYMNENSGSFTFTNNRFEGAFRSMLGAIMGTVTIENNIFTNSIYTNNKSEEATCITTGAAEPNEFIITGNTFDNAGAFYFQKTEGAVVTDNTFKFDRFEHYIQVAGSAAHELDLRKNTFELGENSLVSVDVAAAPILYPAGQEAINYWAWSDTDPLPDDYSAYVYAYNEDGSRTFYPGSEAALDAFMNPVIGNIGLTEGTKDVVYIGQALELTGDAIIPDGATLVLGEGATLTIPQDVTLTNNGTIVNPERIIAEEGTVDPGTGTSKYSVTFQLTPADAAVTVKDSNGSAVAAENGTTFYLGSGSYIYTVSAAGYDNKSGTITVSDSAQIIPVELRKASSSSSSGSTAYAITVAESENGTVTADKKSAAEDKEITLTVTPDEGYVLESLTVTDKDGKEIEVTDKGDGKYTFVMPASKVTVTAVFAQAPVESGLPFTDVDVDDWFYGAVEYVYNNKVMDGTAETIFSPLMGTTRSMIVTMLWRLEGQPQTDWAMAFGDVADDLWYTEAVRWGASEGIVKGYSDTVFAPDDIVSREQLATILYRYAEYKGYDLTAKGDLSVFADGADTSSWAAEAVEWAVGSGLLTGKDGGKLDPTGSATRAEVATILMRFIEG